MQLDSRVHRVWMNYGWGNGLGVRRLGMHLDFKTVY